MRSEPQNIVIAFDVIPTLPCLSRCYERNIVEWVNSTQIDLVHGDMYRWLYMSPSDKQAIEN